MSALARLIPALFVAAAFIPARLSVTARTADDRASRLMLAGASLAGGIWAVAVTGWLS